jgi:SPP1 gp7 family putative phage head morphogenesis protein
LPPGPMHVVSPGGKVEFVSPDDPADGDDLTHDGDVVSAGDGDTVPADDNEVPDADDESPADDTARRRPARLDARGRASGMPEGTVVMAHQERAAALGAAQQEALERQWERAMSGLFARQEAAVVSRLTGKRGRQALRADGDDLIPNIDALFDLAFWVTETELLTASLYEAVLGVAGANLVAEFGVSFDLDSPFARAFITSRANRLAGGVTETTYRDITRVLSDGMGKGLSIPDLADLIRHLFAQTYASRAETVARTEVISSYNGATWEIGQDTPDDVIAGYEWVATLDARVRPDHLGAHGQVSVGGAPFQVGAAQMRYPGDPAGGAKQCVNCRCTLVPLTPDDLAARGVAALESEIDEALGLIL